MVLVMVLVLLALMVEVRGLVESLSRAMFLVRGRAILFTLQQMGQLLKAMAWHILRLSASLMLFVLTLLPTAIQLPLVLSLTSAVASPAMAALFRLRT